MGGGFNVSCSELLNLKCSFVFGGNWSSWYKCGMFDSICFHVFEASLCRYVLIGSKFACSCSVSDGILSAIDVSVMNLMALFCIFCNLDMAVFDCVCSGMAGYVSAGST